MTKSDNLEKNTSTQKDIREKTKECILYDGLFKVYQNKKNAKSYIEIDTTHLDNEYIYFSYVENGVIDSRNVRGRFRGSKIIRIKKFFNKIDFIVENTSYYFNPDSPLSKASDANINMP